MKGSGKLLTSTFPDPQAIAMRVGFEPQHFPRNDTLAQLVNGTHESCAMEDNDCPSARAATEYFESSNSRRTASAIAAKHTTLLLRRQINAHYRSAECLRLHQL